jgi:hypothetical protein
MNESARPRWPKWLSNRDSLSNAASWAAIISVPFAVFSLALVVWQIRETRQVIANGVTTIATPANGSTTTQYSLAAGGTLAKSDQHWQGSKSVIVLDVCSDSVPGVASRCFPQSIVAEVGNGWTALIRLGLPMSATNRKPGGLYLVRLDHLPRARWEQLFADSKKPGSKASIRFAGILNKQAPLAQVFVTRT